MHDRTLAHVCVCKRGISVSFPTALLTPATHAGTHTHAYPLSAHILYTDLKKPRPHRPPSPHLHVLSLHPQWERVEGLILEKHSIRAPAC